MDVKEVRLRRLDELLREHDNNKAKLARALKKQPAQVSQWFTGVRTISEETARDIENRLGKARGWMDKLDDQDDGRKLVLADMMRDLGPDARTPLDVLRDKITHSRFILAERQAEYLAIIDDIEREVITDPTKAKPS